MQIRAMRSTSVMQASIRQAAAEVKALARKSAKLANYDEGGDPI